MSNIILDVLNFVEANNGKLHIMRTLAGWVGGKPSWRCSVIVANNGIELKFEANADTPDAACIRVMGSIEKVWTKPLRTALTSNIIEPSKSATDLLV